MKLTLVKLLIAVNVIIFLFTMLDTTAVYDREDFGSQNCCPKNIYEYQCETDRCSYETCCDYTYTDYNFALVPGGILEKPWTAVTSMFMHVDFFHILYNMLALILFGIYLERVVGWKNLSLIYFAGGIAGSVAYVLFAAYLGEIYVPAVGASGAIYAVIIALMIIRPHDEILKAREKGFFFDVFWVYIFGFLGYMPLFLVGMLFLAVAVSGILIDFMTGGQSGVANSAHLGGAIAGVIIGIYFRSFYPAETDSERYRRPLEPGYEQVAKEEGARVVRRNVFGKYEYVNNQKDAGELEITSEKPLSRQQATQNTQQQIQEQRKKTWKKDNDSGDNSGDELEIIK